MSDQEMKKSRRNFLKKGAVGLAGAAILPSVTQGEMKAQEKESEKKPAKKKKMIIRTLGRTGYKLPVVSMGVMNADNPNLVRAALDAGIVHLDTAHYYQRGRNEEMIGGVIKGRPRDSFVLATKVLADHEDRRTGMFTKDTKAEPFIEKFETSLKRLGLEYVDILYLHNIVRRESTLFEPLLTALTQLKKAGKTRFIGVSTHKNEPEVIRAAVESKVYDVVLTAYNFRQPHRGEVKKAMAYAAEAGLGVVVMKTQAGVYWDRERTQPINMKAALKWALQDEHVHTSIPGFTTFDQMDLDLTVMEDLTLTPQEKKDLKLGDKLAMAGLYCRQCGECLSQCPEDIDIPTLMRSYMYAYGYKNLAVAKETVGDLNLKDIPCTNCGSCSVTCSMGFDVKDRVTDIARLRDVPEDFLV